MTAASTAIPGRPRWLVIVRRDRTRLYANLRESLQGVTAVEVILDRRQVEPASAGTEAPGSDRRTPLTPLEAEQWETLGFRCIHRGDELQVYEAPSEREPSG